MTDSHATLRRSQTRFDSWRGHRASRLVAAGSASILPASVSEARRSSKPQGRVRFPGGGFSVGTTSRPRSVTDSHTTLRRSGTRFNSWRGHRPKYRFPFSIDRPMTLEPDGQATGCNPVQVGSTPTGVSADLRNPLAFPPRPGTRNPIDPAHAPSESRILPCWSRQVPILSGSAQHPGISMRLPNCVIIFVEIGDRISPLGRTNRPDRDLDDRRQITRAPWEAIRP